MKVTVKVEGLRQLETALNELPKAAAKATLRRVAIKALKPFDAKWRANAAPFRLTGALEESGGVGTRLTRRQARLNRSRSDKSTVEVFAGPNDPAAVPGEFGTSRQSARPFVRPAWEATKDEALDIVKTELGTEIEKTARRVAKRAGK